MGDESAHGGDVKLSDHTVVSEGGFGSVIWTVCEQLYALLPRSKRDRLLDGSADRVITPYFRGLTERLLKQCGQEGVSIDSLEKSWSFETREISCVFGSVNWQVSQGLWDTIPSDQRDALCQFADQLIHDFFGEEVFVPFMRYAYRQLRG